MSFLWPYMEMTIVLMNTCSYVLCFVTLYGNRCVCVCVCVCDARVGARGVGRWLEKWMDIVILLLKTIYFLVDVS
jgi:hypothetical protein